ncbi:YALIA101S10e04918g1_1 [Yarrowia lipolytica]|nr:YALIA101S10e04918g1_1 [Yarrowia lipolytica]
MDARTDMGSDQGPDHSPGLSNGEDADEQLEFVLEKMEIRTKFSTGVKEFDEGKKELYFKVPPRTIIGNIHSKLIHLVIENPMHRNRYAKPLGKAPLKGDDNKKQGRWSAHFRNLWVDAQATSAEDPVIPCAPQRCQEPPTLPTSPSPPQPEPASIPEDDWSCLADAVQQDIYDQEEDNEAQLQGFDDDSGRPHEGCEPEDLGETMDETSDQNSNRIPDTDSEEDQGSGIQSERESMTTTTTTTTTMTTITT